MGQWQRHLFGVDPKLDMVYVMMQQTQSERGRITPAFKALVYDCYPEGYAAREARWPKSASSVMISAAGRAALNRKPCTSLQPSARSQSS